MYPKKTVLIESVNGVSPKKQSFYWKGWNRAFPETGNSVMHQGFKDTLGILLLVYGGVPLVFGSIYVRRTIQPQAIRRRRSSKVG